VRTSVALPSVPGRELNWRRVVGWTQRYGIVVAFVGLVAYFAISTDAFLTERNLTNLVEQNASTILLAAGMTVVIIAGEFDLSIGAIMGFTAVVGAWLANEAGPARAVAGALACGAGLGAVNGALVSRLRVQSFLITLATQFLFVGVALYLTAGTDTFAVANVDALSPLGESDVLGLKSKVWIALAVVVALAALLQRAPFGRSAYAVGGNRAAARVAGVGVESVRIGAFTLNGALAGLAGVLAVAETGVAQPTGNVGIEFTVITAVIVGGTSVVGGRGGIGRTLVGVLLLAVIANGFTIAYISPTYDRLVQGAIILLAVMLDAWLKRRATS
jgi:ribose transport system permease protein